MAGIEFMKNLPKDKDLQVGVLDIRTCMIETPTDVADRIREVLKFVSADRRLSQYRLRHEASG